MAVLPNAGSSFTTEVLLFALEEEGLGVSDQPLSTAPGVENGRTCAVSSGALFQPESRVLAAYLAESASHRTGSLLRAGDGSSLKLTVHRMGTGYLAGLVELRADQVARQHMSIFVTENEPAIFRAALAGRHHMVVVKVVATNGGVDGEQAMAAREAFTRAAESYPSLGLLDVRVARAPSDQAEAVSLMTSQMLMLSLLAARL
ncbi:MAG: hypothetical protein IT347_09650 [Candidatus Eisenbacteria bacterium]|nr:hypothetical protein [Candidatus Eisenbacteria bacterium]